MRIRVATALLAGLFGLASTIGHAAESCWNNTGSKVCLGIGYDRRPADATTGIAPPGALVGFVAEFEAADRAGMRAGDIIVQYEQARFIEEDFSQQAAGRRAALDRARQARQRNPNAPLIMPAVR